jgi:hypothetical protein
LGGGSNYEIIDPKVSGGKQTAIFLLLVEGLNPNVDGFSCLPHRALYL